MSSHQDSEAVPHRPPAGREHETDRAADLDPADFDAATSAPRDHAAPGHDQVEEALDSVADAVDRIGDFGASRVAADVEHGAREFREDPADALLDAYLTTTEAAFQAHPGNLIEEVMEGMDEGVISRQAKDIVGPDVADAAKRVGDAVAHEATGAADAAADVARRMGDVGVGRLAKDVEHGAKELIEDPAGALWDAEWAVVDAVGSASPTNLTEDVVQGMDEGVIPKQVERLAGPDVADAARSLGDATDSIDEGVIIDTAAGAAEQVAGSFGRKAVEGTADAVDRAVGDASDEIARATEGSTGWTPLMQTTKGMSYLMTGGAEDDVVGVVHDARDAARDAAETVSGAADDAGDALGDAADDAGDAIGDAADDVGDAIEDANPFD